MDTKQKLLIAVSFFAMMCLGYQLYAVLPDLIDAWKIVQSFRWSGEFVYPFFKILLGLVFQICFFGSVGFWAWYEATGKTTGSLITTTKEGLRKIQLLLLAILGIFSLKLIFDALSTTRASQQFINNLISSVVIMVVLAVPILILDVRLREHKPQRTFQKEEKDDMDKYVENWRKGNQLKQKSFRELYEERKKRELEDRT